MLGEGGDSKGVNRGGKHLSLRSTQTISYLPNKILPFFRGLLVFGAGCHLLTLVGVAAWDELWEAAREEL